MKFFRIENSILEARVILYWCPGYNFLDWKKMKWKKKTRKKIQDISLERHTNGQKVYEKNIQHNESPGKFRSRPPWDIA